ncbi:MAG: MinD/ParA family protein [Pseudobdellovibrionaceae bacterium]|nr:MinD/ParA family protein [Bdellovibrionales bacterium]USN47337.1 MAG: MinD/ParA family protein [Pseudobdellovibrionaceae bacterium]
MSHRIGHQPSTKTISITSGKGGVGKSTLVANLGQYLGKKGHRVLLLDGDLGMSNLDIMYNVATAFSVEHVISGRKFLEDIVVEVAPNVSLIPGGSGVFGLSDLNIMEKRLLMEQVSRLEQHFDYMLIDTAPGIADSVLYLNAAAQETLVIITPDPSSVTDAYALIKVLHQRYRENRFSIVCNMVQDQQEANRLYQRFSDVVSQFLCVSLDLVGFVPLDQELRRATKSQQLIIEKSPQASAAVAIRNVGEKLRVFKDIEHTKGGMQFFWEQIVGVA